MYLFSRSVLVLLSLMLLGPSWSIAQNSNEDSKPSAPPAKTVTASPDDAKQQIKALVEQLNGMINAEKIEAATKIMTPDGLNQFQSDLLFMCVELAGEDPADLPPEFKTLLKVATKHGLDKIELPAAYLDAMESGDWPEDDVIEEAETKVMDAIPPKKRLLIVKEIFQANTQFAQEMSPFMGEVTEIELESETKASAKVEYSEDQIAEIVDQLAEEGQEVAPSEIIIPPTFLTFVKTKNGWKWDGIDMEKTNAAMDEMEFGGVPESLPLVDDIKLNGKNLDGKAVDLKDLKGKVVLIDFWGTWCGPCVAELPKLKKIYSELHDKGFEIIGVANDGEKDLQAFFKKNSLPWHNIVDGKGAIADKFGIRAFPTTLIVNKEGEHVKSDLHGSELLDELINLLGLKAGEADEVRKAISKPAQKDKKKSEAKNSGDESNSTDENEVDQRKVGFKFADSDRNEKLNKSELKTYLNDRLDDDKLPHKKVFSRMDENDDGSVSNAEFDKRHDVIMHFMGKDYFGQVDAPEPVDPGKDFVAFHGLNKEVDDRAIFGALYHRYYELLDDNEKNWKPTDLDEVPASIGGSKIASGLLNGPKQQASESPNERLIKASLIVAGGERDFFTSGAVLISQDGLAITNYHVAEMMAESMLSAMTHDGKSHRVVEFIAGNRDRDVAIIRIEGDGFAHVPIAKDIPSVGDDIVMIHHSENRFFTYDRGYVMRHPMIGDHPWMEISADYAPGGSGCGIFNRKHELVGLVSIIQYGDGPSLAEGMDEVLDENEDEQNLDEEDFGDGGGMLLVKHAVSLSAIHSVLKPVTEQKSLTKSSTPATDLAPLKVVDNKHAALSTKLFDAPVALKLNENMINVKGRIPMPSPAIFDIDNDGKNELVVGDLRGGISIYETKSDSLSVVMDSSRSLKSKGKEIRLSNW